MIAKKPSLKEKGDHAVVDESYQRQSDNMICYWIYPIDKKIMRQYTYTNNEINLIGDCANE